jgi:uncharacterized repeat protein (TIGR03803 family)
MTDANRPRRARHAGAAATAFAAVLFAAAAASAGAAKFADLYDFGVTDAQQNPGGALALGRNGNFYGEEGQSGTSAAIFSISRQGKESLLWTGPGYPDQPVCTTGLTLGADGLLYGTCSIWNSNNAASGAIFQFDPRHPEAGLKPLYVFPLVNPQGSSSNPSRLTLGVDGNLYGTAWSGYTGDVNVNGSVFRITPGGQFTTLYTFQGGAAGDGAEPSALTLASDGDFYGVTAAGGAIGSSSAAGTVFRITPAGVETILTTFTTSTNGQRPLAPVIEGNDGNFYGSTYYGGANNQGTLFRMTPAGQITYLHDFSQTADNGAYPTQPLIQASDGNLYAPATDCSPSSCLVDSLFRITPGGHFTTLYVFPPPFVNGADIPSSPLTQNPDGGFYGLTQFGGPDNAGMFYRLTDGAPQLIVLQSPIGAPGARLGIFGRGFKGATAVAFNGVPASFTVVGDTWLSATIPAGATAGFVTVTEPGATLKSAVVFTPR